MSGGRKRKLYRLKKILLILFIIVMPLICSISAYAGNNDSLPTYGYSGKGDDLWKYNSNYSGMRISIYWAPDEQAFESGVDVIQLGKTIDVSKTGPWYKVDLYTGYSIYWYMNGDNIGMGKNYKSTVTTPYIWLGKGEVYNSKGQDIVDIMPDVWNGTKEEWDNWFEGPIINGNNTYQNIPAIARLCEAEISIEDFKNGKLDIFGYINTGIYKIFFEPVIYPIVDGVPMAMTLRDIIRWEEAFWRNDISTSDGKDLINWITPVFAFTANSQFLIENEAAISMYGKKSGLYNEAFNKTGHTLFGENTSKADTFKVVYDSPDISIRHQQRARIKEQLNPLGGIIYNSMGVGVITPENEEDLNIIDESKVVADIDYNSDGVIKAAFRDNEIFDVAKGIPSGESLYAQVIADSYLYRLSTRSVSGSVSTGVTVEHFDEEGNPKITDVTVSRSYSYYEISSFELYAIKDAVINNDALPGKKVLLTPKGEYKAPTVEITHDPNDKYTYHVLRGNSTKTITSEAVAYEEVLAAAEAAVSYPTVKSDKLIINGKVIMDFSTGLISTDSTPEKISRDVLYEENLLISELTLNGLYESNGSITYSRVYSFNPQNSDTLTFDLDNINSVFVHTPVCANLSISSDDAYNQNPNPTLDTSALVISRFFTVDISNIGTHKNIKGYGNKDYTKYIKDREIRFGFDTYLGTDRSGDYLKANTWYSLKSLGIANSTSKITFYTPAWVDPGVYNVDVRNIAINDVSNGSKTESKANFSPSNTVAIDSKKVEVSGRVYDLTITDIDDVSWELFFRKNKGQNSKS